MFDGELSVLLGRSKVAPYTTGGKAKRIFDVIVASITLFLFLPLFAFVVLLLKLTDPGPVIFSHVRVGQGGRRFACLKFRSMVTDSDKVLKSLLESDPTARAEWERTQKLTNDPRITAVGKFLRQSSLDELPQLINVIRGDMSLVGPRPVVPSEVGRYGEKLGLYLQARPGITGVWQVSGRNDCGYDKRIEMDANYVRNWRISNDIVILMRTLGAVIARKGSY
ncbi:MAG TPA: sugar transferase [Methylocella sp.]|jgi:Undecaprenyl-phosphate galactose phosphotransferase WbaP